MKSLHMIPIFYIPDMSTHIDPIALLKHKGCDASNVFDEEVRESDIEFSDDEKEKLVMRKHRSTMLQE